MKSIIAWSVFVVSLIFLYLSLVLLWRFFTWDFFAPFIDTMGKVGWPSAVTSVIAFFSIFLDKTELQKRIKQWVAEQVENLTGCFYLFVGSCFVGIMVAVLVTVMIPPLKWATFINSQFLKGEQDQYRSAKEAIGQIGSVSSAAKELMSEGLDVFCQRCSVNHDQEALDGERLRRSILFLDRNKTSNMYTDAFVQYSLAEAYSLFGGMPLTENRNYYDLSRKIYNSFLHEITRVKTRDWTLSAHANIGNTYYYQGNYEQAIQEWNLAKSKIGVYLNIASAYIMLDNFSEAIKVLDEGLSRIHGKEQEYSTYYSAFLENKIIALLALQKVSDAINVYKDAFKDGQGVAPDGSLLTAHCISLILAGNEQECITILSKFGGNVINQVNTDLVYALLYLKRGEIVNSKKRFKSFIGVSVELGLQDAQLYSRVKKEMRDRGLLKIPDLRRQLDQKREKGGRT